MNGFGLSALRRVTMMGSESKHIVNQLEILYRNSRGCDDASAITIGEILWPGTIPTEIIVVVFASGEGIFAAVDYKQTAFSISGVPVFTVIRCSGDRSVN